MAFYNCCSKTFDTFSFHGFHNILGSRLCINIQVIVKQRYCNTETLILKNGEAGVKELVLVQSQELCLVFSSLLKK